MGVVYGGMIRYFTRNSSTFWPMILFTSKPWVVSGWRCFHFLLGKTCILVGYLLCYTWVKNGFILNH
jgi:hypothetical protein